MLSRRDGRGRATVLILTLALMTTACGEQAGRATATETADTFVTTSRASTTTTTSPQTSTVAPTVPESTTTVITVGTLDNPLPVGDPDQSAFAYSDFSAEWEGYVIGLVEAPLGQFNDEGGTCVLVLGRMTALSFTSGVTSSGFDTPSVGLIVDGRLIDSDVTACDRDDAEAQGYGWRLDAAVTVGTDYGFYEAFFFSGDELPAIERIVIGSPSDAGARYFEATLLSSIPDLVQTVGPPLRQTWEIAATGVGFLHEESGNAWSGVIHGIVEIPLGRFNDDAGMCLAVLGELTPTTIADGGVSDPFSAARIDLVRAGRVVGSDVTQCDRDDLETAGYGWRLDAEVTASTPYPFYEAFFFPGDGDVVDIDVIVVGNPSADDVVLYEPIMLSSIP